MPRRPVDQPSLFGEPTVTRSEGAAPFVPLEHRYETLRGAIPACRGCELYEHATQAVMGEGPTSGAIMFCKSLSGWRMLIRHLSCLFPDRSQVENHGLHVYRLFLIN